MLLRRILILIISSLLLLELISVNDRIASKVVVDSSKVKAVDIITEGKIINININIEGIKNNVSKFIININKFYRKLDRQKHLIKIREWFVSVLNMAINLIYNLKENL